MNKIPFINERYRLLFTSSVILSLCYCFGVIVNPLIAGMLFGEAAIAGVQVFSSLLYFVEFFAEIAGVGGTILYSKASGVFDKEKMSKVFSISIEFTVGCALVFSGLMFFFMEEYVDIYALGGRVKEIALIYGQYFYILIFIHPIKIVISRFTVMEGDAKTCNLAAFCQLVLGIILPFMFGRLFGVSGIALGYIASVLAALAIICTHFLSSKNTLRFKWSFDYKLFPEFIKYSILDSSVSLYGAVVVFFAQNLIIRMFNEGVLAIFSVSTSVIDLEVMFDSVGSALGAVYENFEGERNYQCLRYVTRLGNKTNIAFGIVFTLIMVIFAPAYVTIFGVTDPYLFNEAVNGLRIISAGALCASCVYYYSSYYLLNNRITLGSFMVFVRDFGAVIVLMPLLTKLIGVNGIWLSFAVAPLISLLLTFAYIIIRYGFKSFPFFFESYDKDKIFVKSFVINKENLSELWLSAKEFLLKNDVDSKTANKIMMLLEELPLIIDDKNKRRVLAEFDIVINDNIDVVIRDDGILFDVTDENLKIESFREFVAGCLVSRIEEKDNLTALSCNRSLFRFKKS